MVLICCSRVELWRHDDWTLEFVFVGLAFCLKARKLNFDLLVARNFARVEWMFDDGSGLGAWGWLTVLGEGLWIGVGVAVRASNFDFATFGRWNRCAF